MKINQSIKINFFLIKNTKKFFCYKLKLKLIILFNEYSIPIL